MTVTRNAVENILESGESICDQNFPHFQQCLLTFQKQYASFNPLPQNAAF